MRKNGFFAMMTRMRNIARWGLMRNSIQENLAEHSFDTAVTAHALALIGREHFGRQVDPGKVAAAALFHDAPEIITGDLPTPSNTTTRRSAPPINPSSTPRQTAFSGCFRRSCAPITGF